MKQITIQSPICNIVVCEDEKRNVVHIKCTNKKVIIEFENVGVPGIIGPNIPFSGSELVDGEIAIAKKRAYNFS